MGAIGIREMKVHYIPGVGYDSNVYLVEDEDPIVVDAGTGMFADATLEAISEVVPLRRVERIVLTHCHYDHMGGAERLSQGTGGRVLLHESEAAPIRAGDSTLTLSDMFGKSMQRLEVEPLKTGQTISTGSTRLEVLHTPGHSPGSICLYDKEGASAIVGDTVFCDGGVGRWDLPGGDLAQLISSVKRIQELGLRNMYPGHGSFAEGDAPQHLRLAANYITEAY